VVWECGRQDDPRRHWTAAPTLDLGGPRHACAAALMYVRAQTADSLYVVGHKAHALLVDALQLGVILLVRALQVRVRGLG